MLYSHSRIKTFEQCPHKFRLKYIDKAEAPSEQGIEAFLGTMVHKTLEKLYADLKFQKKNTLKEILNYFMIQWRKNWNKEIIIVRKDYDQKNYRDMGVQFIKDYYKKYKPFNHARTLGLEKRIVISLDPAGKYKLQGYIDRVSMTPNGVYEIHDYKTNANLSPDKYLEEDRQLALYSVAIKEMYSDAKDVKLIWHFLAFNKQMMITKTPEELNDLKKNTIELINKIESENHFRTKTSKLCDWCEFRNMCPEWKHISKTDELLPNKFLKEPGVVLVNKYAELQAKIKHMKDEMDELKEAMVQMAEKEGMSVLTGSDHSAKIWIAEKSKFPGRTDEGRAELEDIVKKSGRWEEFSNLDTFKLEKMAEEGKLSKDFLEKIKKFQKLTKLEKIYLRKKVVEE